MASRQKQIRIIRNASRRHGIKPRILWGLYGAETNFGQNTNASSAGAQGPFQFMPGTARSYGINPHNFRQAADAAAKYLATYKGRGVAGMLAAYNAGPAGNPNNPETRAYVPRVRQLARTWPGAPGGSGGGSGGRQRGNRRGSGVSVRSTPGRLPAPTQGGTDIADYLAGSMSSRPQVAVSPPPEPEFSARRYLSGAYQAPAGGAPGPQPRGLDDALEAISRLTGEDVPKPEGGRTTVTVNGQRGGGGGAGGGGGVRGGRGKVVIRAGADRAGVPTRPVVKNFLSRVAGIYGKPLTVGTGSNHSRLTSSGNVSDHWDGHGADVPAAGAELTRMGRAALVAAGMKPSQARAAKGGIYNLRWRGRRVQIIFNTDDHWDHLHAGLR